MLKIGHLIARTFKAGVHEGAMIDTWVAHVMPHAVTWNGTCPSAPPTDVSDDAVSESKYPLSWVSTLCSRAVAPQRKRGLPDRGGASDATAA